MSQAFAAQLPSVLHSLKDIENVRGSFVVARNGQLIARDLPAMFTDEALSEVATRAARLWETLAELDRSLDQSVLQYRDHKVYIRAVVQGFLCALVDAHVNASALRMALNLVIKRVNPLLAEIDLRELQGTPPPPATAAVPTPPPAVVSLGPEAVEASSKRGFIVYRGRRYEVS